MNSDDSGESGAAGAGSAAHSSFNLNLTPPTLDDCVFESQLFLGFMRYLGQVKANENLLFIKYAYLFSLFNRPLREKYAVACRIIWTFIADYCPCPVNISAETRNKLNPFIWRVDGIKMLKDDMFDEAVGEIKMLLTPMFNKWLESNEWQQIPFSHIPPPNMSTIIRLENLRTRFAAFLEERRKEPEVNKNADEDYKMFEMCTKLYDALQQTKAEGASNKEIERKARHFLKTIKADLQSLSAMKEMEFPKHQHKKKHQESADKQIANAADGATEESHVNVDFMKRALNILSVGLMTSECYERFSEGSNWKGVDLKRLSLQQTIGKDGFAEEPTLSAILHSPTYGPLIMECLKGTEKHAQLSFLLEVQDFYSRFNKPELSDEERKDLQAEAMRIHENYLDKSDLELPKRVRTDLAKAIHSSTSKPTPLIFQTAGSWIFNRIAKSWIREANSLTLWADHDFDNLSPEAQEMDELFNISHINENPLLACENLGLVPHPDDVIGNPQLLESFCKFIPPSPFSAACFALLRGSKEVFALPIEARPAKYDELIELMVTISKESPKIMPFLIEIQQHFSEEKAALNPLVFWKPVFGITKMMMYHYYLPWASKCKSVYKSGGWEPVKALTFVAGHAVPGTSWVTTLGVSTDTAEIAMPSTKKKWGLRAKHRSVLRRTESEAFISGHKSLSFGSPLASRGFIASPKDDSSASRESSSSELLSSSKGDLEANPSRLPVTMPRSIPELHMEIPTILDTLACTHLRRMFFSSFLEYRFGDDEKKLWSTLCKFHADFSSLTDTEVTQRQKDIRAAALKVLEDNPTLPCHDDLMKILDDSACYISAKFFFDAEVKLYNVFHNNYQSFLAKNQWVRY